MHRHVAIISYTFGVALLNCRGGGVVLKFDVFSYCCAGGGGGGCLHASDDPLVR